MSVSAETRDLFSRQILGATAVVFFWVLFTGWVILAFDRPTENFYPVMAAIASFSVRLFVVAKDWHLWAAAFAVVFAAVFALAVVGSRAIPEGGAD